MDTKVLEKLGLTKNEIIIYLFLLKKGETTTGPIIQETKIVNSRVYESLNSLVSRGIVSYNVQKDGKHFQAVDPKILIEKQKELAKKIQELVPELSSIRKEGISETKIAIYEGLEGFRTAYKKMIEDCPKNKTIYILGFSEQAYKSEELRLFLSNLNLKSAQKKHKLKIILDVGSKETLGRDRAREKISEVRYMPKGYISPSAIDIFEDYVYISIWEEKPIVMMIKNDKVAESFQRYFHFLWKLAKK